MSDSLLEMGDEPFVQLTTYRRNGEGVGTTVWVARDGDALLVTTVDGTGKVKRLRNDSRVTLRPSSRLGRVADGAPEVEAHAEIDRDPAAHERLEKIFRAKYGLQYRLIVGAERRLSRDEKPRIVLRITDGPEPGQT